MRRSVIQLCLAKFLIAAAVDAAKLLSVDLAKAPQDQSRASRRRSSTGQPIYDQLAIDEYYAQIEVGDPLQSVILFIDTESSDAFVYGSNTNSYAICIMPFNFSQSALYKEIPDTLETGLPHQRLVF
jgi:hypothetical protein